MRKPGSTRPDGAPPSVEVGGAPATSVEERRSGLREIAREVVLSLRQMEQTGRGGIFLYLVLFVPVGLVAFFAGVVLVIPVGFLITSVLPDAPEWVALVPLGIVLVAVFLVLRTLYRKVFIDEVRRPSVPPAHAQAPAIARPPKGRMRPATLAELDARLAPPGGSRPDAANDSRPPVT